MLVKAYNSSDYALAHDSSLRVVPRTRSPTSTQQSRQQKPHMQTLDDQEHPLVRTNDVEFTSHHSTPATETKHIANHQASHIRTTLRSTTMSSAVARSPRRRMAWLKAQARYARDCVIQEYSDLEKSSLPCDSRQPPHLTTSLEPSPKRKQAAFVKDEELNFMLEDRAGTPHLSELQHDEEVTPTLLVEELGMTGAVDPLRVGT